MGTKADLTRADKLLERAKGTDQEAKYQERYDSVERTCDPNIVKKFKADKKAGKQDE